MNFSHNEITEIPDLSGFPYLQSLNVDHNQISEIVGLENCRSLKKISLSYNRIEKMKGLDNLRISHLSLVCTVIKVNMRHPIAYPSLLVVLVEAREFSKLDQLYCKCLQYIGLLHIKYGKLKSNT